MTLLVQEALSQIKHTLSGDLSSDLSAIGIVNEACQYVTSEHPWKYLERPSVTLNTVISTNYCVLPTDYREPIDIQPTAGLVNNFQWTDLGYINQLRTNEIAVGNYTWFGAVSWQPDITSAGGPPIPHLEIYPTPSANGAATFTLFYRAGWVDISEDAFNIPVPPFLETYVRQVIRAFARGYEEEDQGSLASRLLELAPLRAQAIQRDGMLQTDYGKMRGGAVDSMIPRIGNYLRSTVLGPS